MRVNEPGDEVDECDERGDESESYDGVSRKVLKKGNWQL